MRTITTHTTVYAFDELSDDAKARAVENMAMCNVDYSWWDTVYDDARNIGIDISHFDIDRCDIDRCDIGGKLTMDIDDSIQAVLKNHGDMCDTHKTATEYRARLQPLQAVMVANEACDTQEQEDAYYDAESAIEALEGNYSHNMLSNYLSILRKEFDYLTSEEAIVETIRANEWEFLEGGQHCTL